MCFCSSECRHPSVIERDKLLIAFCIEPRLRSWTSSSSTIGQCWLRTRILKFVHMRVEREGCWRNWNWFESWRNVVAANWNACVWWLQFCPMRLWQTTLFLHHRRWPLLHRATHGFPWLLWLAILLLCLYGHLPLRAVRCATHGLHRHLQKARQCLLGLYQAQGLCHQHLRPPWGTPRN